MSVAESPTPRMDEAIVKSVSAMVDREWIAEQTLALVEIPSVTMDEAAVCRYYATQMQQLGLTVDVREVTPGRANLYARIAGSGNGPSLLFNGHLDTIPLGDCVPCSRQGDRIYGRGATDMKGAMAAMLGAVRALLASGVRLNGDLWLTAVVGHEEPEAAKDGPLALIEDLQNGRVSCDRILIGEGWDELWVMSMGSLNFTITLDSPLGGTHTTYVPFGQNPIRYLGELIGRITAYQQELDADTEKYPVHRLAGAERIDLGIVQAGDYFNRTPGRCTLTGTRRWNPGRTADEVLAELHALAAPIAAAGNLDLRVEMVHEREPFETPDDDPAVRAVAAAHQLVTGESAVIAGKRIVGDANLYVNLGHRPAFYYGPSNETAHSDLEWVSITRLAQAAKVYALSALIFCGMAG